MHIIEIIKRHWLSSSVIYILLLSVIGLTYGVSNRQSGAKTRTVKHLSWRNEPIEIVFVKIEGREAKFNEEVASSGSWLRDLTLTVKNTSQKPIIFINLYLDFPETKASGNPMTFPIRWGQSPRQPEIVAPQSGSIQAEPQTSS